MASNTASAFLNACNNAKRKNMFLDRSNLPGKETFNYCDKAFRELTGDKFNGYNNEDITCEVLDMIPDYHKILTGVGGIIEVDYMHLLLVHRIMKNKGDSREKVIRGLLYKYGKEHLETMIKKLKLKFKPGTNFIDSKIVVDEKAFGWDGCKIYFYRCFMSWLKEQGFRQYYYEKPMQNLIATAMFFSNGKMGYPDAEHLVYSKKEPFFIEGLDKYFENIMAPYILAGNVRYIDGIYAEAYTREDIKLRAKESYEGHNIYSLFIRSYLMRINGQFCEEFRKDRNFDYKEDDMYINYVSPARVGIKIRDYLDIEEGLKVLHPMLKRQERFSIDKFIMGEYIHWEV